MTSTLEGQTQRRLGCSSRRLLLTATCFLLAPRAEAGRTSSIFLPEQVSGPSGSYPGPSNVEEDIPEDALLAADDVSPSDSAASSTDAAGASQSPHLVRLRRESVPVYRRGKIVSFKTSYSGTVALGTPAQLFRVVFDTGSGNVIIPSKQCKSEACLVHETFDQSASSSAISVDVEGRPLNKPDGDQVVIGFGTGEITGEFMRDTVCILSERDVAEPAWTREQLAANASERTGVYDDLARKDGPCTRMNVILAVEMSNQPFKALGFDGIFGLGLAELAMNAGSSAFHLFSTQLGAPQFAAFLTDGANGEVSEMAFGGYNEDRLLGSLSWSPVAMRDLGFWQVVIVGVYINGLELDICKDGSCRAVVDTGSSHLGVPKKTYLEMSETLAVESGELLDCRLVQGAVLEFVLLGNVRLTLGPHNYMRRLPLRDGVNVSGGGIHSGQSSPTTNATESGATTEHAKDLPAQAPVVETNLASPMNSTEGGVTGRPSASELAPALADNATQSSGLNSTGGFPVPATEAEEAPVKRICQPRVVSVGLPAPLGPNLFIFGEPVLHRYYTVFDWSKYSVGFAPANNRMNTEGVQALSGPRGLGELPDNVEVLLMQQYAGR